ncbi:MAG: class I SAM-dependent methyltransferase [Deltaproteobacteria bacterium]|nr:class I SAM-dependent methyltransferase [Deltaproteobacteria bacterium]
MIENELMYKRLRGFIDRGIISKTDKTLVVCGWEFDQQALDSLGFTDFVITSMAPSGTPKIKNYRTEDVERLSFADNSFDNVIVHAGLHHCYSPHKAVCEMYRVAKKNVIIFEAQDSFTLRLFSRLGLALDYEVDAVIQSNNTSGGVNNLPIPNYIYRWTKREIEKLVRSFDPVGEPEIAVVSEFYCNPCHMEGFLKEHIISKMLGKTAMLGLIKISTALLNLFLRSQGNCFTVLVRKDSQRLHRWMKKTDKGYEFTG